MFNKVSQNYWTTGLSKHPTYLYLEHKYSSFDFNFNIDTYPDQMVLNYPLFSKIYYPSKSFAKDLKTSLYLTYSHSFQESKSLSLNRKNDMENNTSQVLDNNRIYSSSYREKLLLDYHTRIHENNLTSYAEYEACRIMKEDYDKLFNLTSLKYINGTKSDLSSSELFLEDHTYYRLSYNKKTNDYYLLTYFTIDPAINQMFKGIKILKEPAMIKWCTGLDRDGDLLIDNVPLDCPSMIHESFYPWLNGLSIDEYIDNYMESEESILLLYNKMGTGKSNFLKYLLNKTGESALITYQDSLRDLDQMFSYFISSKTVRFLIVEDADEFLVKREQGNSAMKRLLNVADGLTSNKTKKIIFTTNLSSINSIDEALLRPGRCFDSVEFKSYTSEEALEVCKVLNIDGTLLNTNLNYTLAELFSIKNNKAKKRLPVKKNTSRSFGFSK